jgi:hypothetical protein
MDSKDFIWLIGGSGYSTSATIGNLGDAWRFSTASGAWSYQGGTQLLDQPSTIAQAKYLTSYFNIMGCRQTFAMAISPRNDLYVWGGTFAGTDTGSILLICHVFLYV